MMLMRLLICCGLLVSLAACITTNDRVKKVNAVEACETQSFPWWLTLNDPLATELVMQLQEQNLDIKMASARVAQARGMASSAKGALLPQIGLSGNAVRGNTATGAIKPTSIAQGGLDAAWELDIFGATRAATQAAEHRVEASVANVQDIRNSVIAELMMALVRLRQSQQELSQTHLLLAALHEQAELLAAQSKAGLTDARALKLAQGEHKQVAAGIPLIRAKIAASQYQIERLLGKAEGSLGMEVLEYKEIEVPEANMLDQVSIDKIRKRPDVRSARAELFAANADLAKAEADLWPKISLAAFYGAHKGSSSVPLAANPIWSVAASISAPMLEFGRLRGLVDAADAGAQQAVLNYENVVLIGLEEARTALSDYLSGLNAICEQEQLLRHDQEALELAQKRFKHGLVDMVELSAATAKMQRSKLLLISTKAEAVIAYILLQKATGNCV
ncbi:MAG: efflux transporter outer membrane subunit [Proteobacteria bacterium]|nr:efflux transporter outer membrane subunit [Pseudomonadota bacterium]